MHMCTALNLAIFQMVALPSRTLRVWLGVIARLCS